MNARENDFNPPSKNGVYLLSVESIYDGYLVKGGSDSNTVIQRVKINGRYIATSDYFETECDDYEITEDNTLILRYDAGDPDDA